MKSSFSRMMFHLCPWCLICFNVVSIGGVLSRQASLPIQRHHILSRAMSSHSSHHTSHTDDSYTLYSSTRPVLTHHNGLDQHSGSVRIRLLGMNSRIHAYKLIISPQEPIQASLRAKKSSIPDHANNI